MTSVVALITAHSRELVDICAASLWKYAPTIRQIWLVTHPSCFGPGPLSVMVPNLHPGIDARNHALALEHARRHIQSLQTADIVLLLDDDVVVLHPHFIMFLLGAFAGDVGAWGAEGIRDPLHPSCLAMRRVLWEKVSTFDSALPAHDTTGLAQAQIRSWGYKLLSVPRTVAPEGWETFDGLWAHLGGGVVHAPVHPVRRLIRHVRAATGHEPSRDLIEKAGMRKRWVEMYGH